MKSKKLIALLVALFVLTSCSNNKIPTQDDIILEKNLIINDLENTIRGLQTEPEPFYSEDDQHLIQEHIIEVDAIVIKASTNSIDNKYTDLAGPWALFYAPDFEKNQALFFRTNDVTTMVLEENQQVVLEIKHKISYDENSSPVSWLELLNISNP